MMTVKDLVSKLTGARAAVRDLGDAARGLREEHDRLAEERSGLLSTWPPVDEIVAEAAADVDAIGARWRADHAKAVAEAARSRLDVTPNGQVNGVARSGLGPLTIRFDFAAACGLLPAIVKEAIATVIRAGTADVPTGPPMAARAEMVAQLNERLATVARQHAALVDEANAAGIGLSHLAEERGRRYAVERARSAAQMHNRINAAAIRRGAVQPLEET